MGWKGSVCVYVYVCVLGGGNGVAGGKKEQHTHTYICEPTCHKITNITRRKVGFI